MKRICICGGGSLGHVIAGYLSAKKDVEVNKNFIYPPQKMTLYTGDCILSVITPKRFCMELTLYCFVCRDMPSKVN